jgi:hypothetical protein
VFAPRVANALITLRANDGFRPVGPPALGSRQWAQDFNEVKRIGSLTSGARTASQTKAALFWAETPVQQAHLGRRGVIAQRKLDVVQAARMMAMVSVSYADGMIACFDATFAFEFWRPITAVPAGYTDGNRRTVADPAWKPLLAGTPNLPEYPSAHSCITPAGGEALAEFLGTRGIDLTMPSLTGLGSRHFATLRALTPGRSAMPGSGAASTSGPRSRTAYGSPGRSRTRCWTATSSGSGADDAPLGTDSSS